MFRISPVLEIGQNIVKFKLRHVVYKPNLIFKLFIKIKILLITKPYNLNNKNRQQRWTKLLIKCV